MNMKFSNRYEHHKLPGLDFTDHPSKTKQEYLEEVNINAIVARNRDGISPRTEGREPTFGDFTDPRITDYAQALQTMRGVGELMMELPAAVRARFRNDPADVLAFVQDPANTEEAHRLGLLRDDYQSPSQPPPTTPPAPITTPAPAVPPKATP